MNETYFNYSHTLAWNRWDRYSFAANWWRIYSSDPNWVPPYYPDFRRLLEPARNPHLERLQPLYVQFTAMARQARSGLNTESLQTRSGIPDGFPSERVVAVALVLADPRRQDNTAYLALPHCANDPESLERLLYFSAELLAEDGYRRLIGPTGLSPHLGSGLLLDHWNLLPPLYTAYDPPYLSEIAASLLTPLETFRLYHLRISTQVGERFQDPSGSPAQIERLDPVRLRADLLPLFAGALAEGEIFPRPDEQETSFLLSWIGRWPVQAWFAQVNDRPAGFVLLQPDLAPHLKRANGGRSLFWRAWLSWSANKPARRGRLVFGSVLPDWRGQGIGSQLFRHSVAAARELGWETLSIGPLPTGSEAARFLEQRGATPRQTYGLYEWEF